MARFATLCSSSSGNCVYAGDSNGGVLIDAGMSCKKIRETLASLKINETTIKAILVTHEHTDHTAGIRVLASKLKIPVYATPGTMAGLNDCGILDGSFAHVFFPAEGLDIGSMHISCFATSHDARQSCGYVIEFPELSVGICTDTGVITPDAVRALSECQTVLIESNYDEDLLDFGPYTPALKARIRSRTGHLSNSDCADCVCDLFNSGVRRFVLGHLSRENNTPEKALACTRQALKRMGIMPNEYELIAAPVEAMGEYIVL